MNVQDDLDASSSKKKTTFAKMNREAAVRSAAVLKQAKKDARKQAAAEALGPPPAAAEAEEDAAGRRGALDAGRTNRRNTNSGAGAVVERAAALILAEIPAGASPRRTLPAPSGRQGYISRYAHFRHRTRRPQRAVWLVPCPPAGHAYDFYAAARACGPPDEDAEHRAQLEPVAADDPGAARSRGNTIGRALTRDTRSGAEEADPNATSPTVSRPI